MTRQFGIIVIFALCLLGFTDATCTVSGISGGYTFVVYDALPVLTFYAYYPGTCESGPVTYHVQVNGSTTITSFTGLCGKTLQATPGYFPVGATQFHVLCTVPSSGPYTYYEATTPFTIYGVPPAFNIRSPTECGLYKEHIPVTFSLTNEYGAAYQNRWLGIQVEIHFKVDNLSAVQTTLTMSDNPLSSNFNGISNSYDYRYTTLPVGVHNVTEIWTRWRKNTSPWYNYTRPNFEFAVVPFSFTNMDADTDCVLNYSRPCQAPGQCGEVEHACVDELTYIFTVMNDLLHNYILPGKRYYEWIHYHETCCDSATCASTSCEMLLGNVCNDAMTDCSSHLDTARQQLLVDALHRLGYAYPITHYDYLYGVVMKDGYAIPQGYTGGAFLRNQYLNPSYTLQIYEDFPYAPDIPYPTPTFTIIHPTEGQVFSYRIGIPVIIDVSALQLCDIEFECKLNGLQSITVTSCEDAGYNQCAGNLTRARFGNNTLTCDVRVSGTWVGVQTVVFNVNASADVGSCARNWNYPDLYPNLNGRLPPNMRDLKFVRSTLPYNDTDGSQAAYFSYALRDDGSVIARGMMNSSNVNTIVEVMSTLTGIADICAEIQPSTGVAYFLAINDSTGRLMYYDTVTGWNTSFYPGTFSELDCFDKVAVALNDSGYSIAVPIANAVIPATPVASVSIVAAGDLFYGVINRATLNASLKPGGATICLNHITLGSCYVFNVTEIAAAYDNAVFVKADGTLVHWYTTGNCTVPASAAGAVAVYTGGGNAAEGKSITAAVLSNGTVVYWACNGTVLTPAPAEPGSLIYLDIRQMITMLTYDRADCYEPGYLYGWGLNDSESIPHPLTYGKMLQISASPDDDALFAHAILENYRVIATGKDILNTSIVSNDVWPATPIIQISSGRTHVLGLTELGGVVMKCYSGYGGSCVVPAEVTDAILVRAGPTNYAILFNGTIVSWGLADPCNITGLHYAVDLALHSNSCIVSFRDGRIVGYGKTFSPTQTFTYQIGMVDLSLYGNSSAVLYQALRTSSTVVDQYLELWGGSTPNLPQLVDDAEVDISKTFALVRYFNKTIYVNATTGVAGFDYDQQVIPPYLTDVLQASVNPRFIWVLAEAGDILPELAIEEPIDQSIWHGSYWDIPLVVRLTNTLSTGSRLYCYYANGDEVVSNVTCTNSSICETVLPYAVFGLNTLTCMAYVDNYPTNNDTTNFFVYPSTTCLIGLGDNSAGQLTIPPVAEHVWKISAGEIGGLLLADDGSIYTIGNVPPPPTPITAIDIAVSKSVYPPIPHFYLAVLPNNTVYQWGDLTYPPPVGLTNVETVEAGAMLAVAKLQNKTVVGWGSNSYNELDDLATLQNVRQAVACDFAILIVFENNTLRHFGQSYTYPPQWILDSTEIASVDCYSHAIALLLNGTVVAWGDNSTTAPAPELEVPSNLTQAVAVIAGYGASYAITPTFEIVAWGDNTYGELDVPQTYAPFLTVAGGYHIAFYMTEFCSDIPPPGHCTIAGCVVGIGGHVLDGIDPLCALEYANIVDISAGERHSAALADNGTIFAWGLNVMNSTDVPFTLPACQAVAAGGYHTIAVCGGLVYGWGWNNYGQAVPLPATIPGPILGLTDITRIDAGLYHSMALHAGGGVSAWGNNNRGQTLVPLDATFGICAIAAGTEHSVALKCNGSVVAWGSNFFGESTVPTAVSTRNVTQIAAGEYFTLVLFDDGTIYGWGDNSDGKLDIPSGLSSVVAIATSAGGHHSLALLANGTVVGWGSNDYGQYDVPVSLPPVIKISAGDLHSLLLTDVCESMTTTPEPTTTTTTPEPTTTTTTPEPTTTTTTPEPTTTEPTTTPEPTTTEPTTTPEPTTTEPTTTPGPTTPYPTESCAVDIALTEQMCIALCTRGVSIDRTCVYNCLLLKLRLWEIQCGTNGTLIPGCLESCPTCGAACCRYDCDYSIVIDDYEPTDIITIIIIIFVVIIGMLLCCALVYWSRRDDDDDDDDADWFGGHPKRT